jgi:uroporphyrinogen decarboxylase
LNHFERIETCLTGGPLDRPPVALWRHFPVDDQTPQGLASSTLAFQQAYDFDIVKVTPASSFCLKDWGVQDEWRGATEGTRDYTRRVIQIPDDWLKLSPLDPYHGYLNDQIICLDMICRNVKPVAPVIQTIFSPLAQAKNLVGGETLLVHMRQYPEAVHAGLKVITESIKAFIHAASKTGIAGIFYAVQHANYHLLTEDEYHTFGEQYDRDILSSLDNLWLNMLHLHGNHVMYNLFLDYPIQAINWHDRDTAPDLTEARKITQKVLCGGLQRDRTMVLGTPQIIRSEAAEAISLMEGKGFILGTGCVLPTIVPHVNILAARQCVESTNADSIQKLL